MMLRWARTGGPDWLPSQPGNAGWPGSGCAVRSLIPRRTASGWRDFFTIFVRVSGQVGQLDSFTYPSKNILVNRSLSCRQTHKLRRFPPQFQPCFQTFDLPNRRLLTASRAWGMVSAADRHRFNTRGWRLQGLGWWGRKRVQQPATGGVKGWPGTLGSCLGRPMRLRLQSQCNFQPNGRPGHSRLGTRTNLPGYLDKFPTVLG
jgi:hypothetical protein